MKTIVITGASTGIGKATALYFAQKGWKVAATMRTPEKDTELRQHDNIKLYTLDVTKEDTIASATNQILQDFGKVDVVLNNAGYGLFGVFEACGKEEIRRQFDTNLFGVMDVTRSFLPHFRQHKAGMFINVTSVGGVVTFPYISFYHSTKWALEGFTESLSYELAELGITAKLVEPGAVATDFGSRSLSMVDTSAFPDYHDGQGRFQKKMMARMEESNVSSAEHIAEGIYNAATDGKTQIRYVLGEDAKETVAQRKEVGDDAFIAGIKSLMLSK